MIEEVFKRIDESRIVKLARELIRIPSENPPGDHGEIAEFLFNELASLGMKVEKHRWGEGKYNVVAFIGEGERSLMLNGHMDTVPAGEPGDWSVNPFSGEVIDGKIYGRGSADMKGAISSMIEAMRALIDSNVKLNGRLMLAFVADEEVSGFGTKKLVDDGLITNYAVIGEPTELKVNIAHKGFMCFKIIVRGKAIHASLPEQGVNAIYKMAKICLKLQELNSRFKSRKHYLLGSPTLNVGVIRGGLKVNIVPDYCEILVDRRLIPGESCREAEMEVRELIDELSREDPELKASIEVLACDVAPETSKDELIVKVCREAVREVVGADPGIAGFTATCDMRFLVNRAGIPTVILGPGSLTQAHTVDEFIEVSELVNAAKIYAAAILKTLC